MSVDFSAEDQRAGCTHCPLAHGRRRFLRDALAAVGALVALGASRKSALAMPIELVRASRRTDQTVTYPIPATDGAQIDKDNQVIIVRWQNLAYAFNLSCPHQNTALRWDDADHRFECPKHHSKYQPDGLFISGRATRGMDRLGIQRQGQNLLVDLDQFYRQDKNTAEWNAAFVDLSK